MVVKCFKENLVWFSNQRKLTFYLYIASIYFSQWGMNENFVYFSSQKLRCYVKRGGQMHVFHFQGSSDTDHLTSILAYSLKSSEGLIKLSLKVACVTIVYRIVSCVHTYTLYGEELCPL